uniref:Lysozyme n=1 Tax=Bracon brevicornis TaxID=1563983 RepID=A0A6V7KD07_9HYME
MSALKKRLSAAVFGLILAGAPASVILDRFLDEKEGNHLTAYPDGGGVWTICGGVTRVDGKPVVKGMKLTAEQCAKIDAIEQQKALDWVDRNVKVPLTEVQKVGIASFCPWSIGPGNCFTSTFYRKLNAGDVMGACKEIKRWIWDGGKDCRIRSNNCYGQIARRDQESELTCWGLDK